MVTHVGPDPRRDIRGEWPAAEAMQMLAREEIDAFMGFPPEPQEPRASASAVVVNTTIDKPCGRSTSAAW